jgi:phage-related protein
LDNKLKILGWVGSSKKDLKTFPEDVRDEIGYALHIAQCGKKHISAKPLKGLSGVMEIVSDYNTDTYRAVYTVNIKDIIYYSAHSCNVVPELRKHWICALSKS